MLGAEVATSAPPLVSRINVVYLYVRDVARSLSFYRDLLGLPLEGDEHWAEAQLPGGVRFALHVTHDAGPVPSSGTIHLDFEVTDADAAADALRAAGVEVRGTVRDEWGTAVEGVDPDGYSVFLYQPSVA